MVGAIDWHLGLVYAWHLPQKFREKMKQVEDMWGWEKGWREAVGF